MTTVRLSGLTTVFAVADRTLETAKTTTPTFTGRTGPRSSQRRPPKTMARICGNMNAVNAQANT